MPERHKCNIVTFFRNAGYACIGFYFVSLHPTADA